MSYLDEIHEKYPYIGSIKIEIDIREISVLHRYRLVYQFKMALRLTSSNISARQVNQ
jgi:hypothetical protein